MRREFLAKSLKVFPLLFLLKIHPSKSESSQNDYKIGDIHPSQEVPETSAILKLQSLDVITRREHFEFRGEGHSHKVRLTREAYAKISQNGRVVVRSGPSDTASKHTHWVLVKPG
ncbi:MAG: hypothetical protein AAF202_12360 [Pseudomonadota bacterium]